MGELCSKLLRIIKLEMVNYIIIFTLCIVATVICFLLRNDRIYRILLWASIAGLIVIVVFFLNTIIPICNDYFQQSFVELEKATILSTTSSGFDLSGIREIVVYDEDGRSIKLKTIVQIDQGEYTATVIYSKESRYLVDYQIMN